MKRFKELRAELKSLAEQESTKWFRIARKAEQKGCSRDLVNGIRKEAFWLHSEASAYPERLISPELEYGHRYIFR